MLILFTKYLTFSLVINKLKIIEYLILYAMNHSTLPATPEELTQAYKLARLRQIGVSYQRAIMTDSIRIALHCTAIALRSKQPKSGTNQGEVK